MRTIAVEEPAQAVETLFGAYRRRILALLLLHAADSFYIREIARLTGIPAGSLHRELVTLAGAGLLARSASGNQVRYQAEVSHPLFEDLAAIFRKTTGLADVLRDALAPLADRIDLALVFGSVAQGQERGDSDVDLLVVGPVLFEAVVEAVQPASQTLRREVNPVVMHRDEFQAKRQRGDRFVTRVLSKPFLLLLGSPDESGEPGPDRPAQAAPRGRGGDPATAGRRSAQPVRRKDR